MANAPSQKIYLGIDLGGTNTVLGLVGPEGLRASRTLPTKAEDGPRAWLERLAQEVRELKGGEEIVAAGIGSPGSLDRERGVVLFSPNLPAWNGFALRDRTAEALGFPVALENDANVYALGEQVYGAGRGHDDLACLTLGTGVGGGLIIEGRLVAGPLGIGGELGHMLVEAGGRLCGCGARGCLEAYASATGLSGMLREALDQGRYTSLERGAGPPELAQAAADGDELAQDIWHRAGVALGRAVADLAVLAGLDLVILGGGVATSWDLMRPAARAELAARLRLADPGRVTIETAELGGDAPLLGSAAYARDHLNL